MLLAPFSRLGVEIVGIQFLRSLQLFDEPPESLHLVLVDRVAGNVRQVAELHVEGTELRQNAGPTACPTEVFG